MTKFKAAVYLRLSRDDGEEGRTESNSITNQRNLINGYVKDTLDISIVDEYIDDGYSGASFARPSFIEMMNDVDIGKINCIIVKDLSRFGRDYIESGKYIQKVFPMKGVRFIAINDNYDSLYANTSESHLVLPVKNFVNDSYCRDISTKVKSAQHVKRKKGEYIGAFSCYGYAKDKDDKNKLVIDEFAAEVVKLIFKYKLEGYSNNAIASKLNSLGYLSPMSYKISNGMNYKSGFSSGINTKWSSNSVRRILKNKIYIGVLEQGKTIKVNYKIDKRIETDQKDWIVVEDAHEPIISEEIFYRVQEMNKRDLYLTGKTPKLFTGMLYCKDCGSGLLRRVNRYKDKETVFYICSEYNRNKNCTRHSIRQDKLEKIVIESINNYYSNKTNLYSKIVRLKNKEVADLDLEYYDTQLLELQSNLKKYRILKSSLYEDLQEGIIDEGEFAKFRNAYTIKIKTAEEAIKNQELLLAKVVKEIRQSQQKLEEMKKFKKITKLTRNIFVTAIDKIYIGENNEINIIFHGYDVEKYLSDYVASFDFEKIKEAI